ncbi:MAG: caspase family protein [Hyphomicrobiales bacterium]
MADFATDFFVCHASTDGAATARRIVDDLETRDVRCWIAPRNIPLGKTWPSAIVSGIEGSRAMLLVVSEAANASEEIEKEVTLAAHLRKVIFPVRIADVPLSGTLLYQVQTRQWRDLFVDREAVLDEIAAQIRSMRGAEPSPPMAASFSGSRAKRPANREAFRLGRRSALGAILGASTLALGYAERDVLGIHVERVRDLLLPGHPGQRPSESAGEPGSATPPLGRRVALVIGESEYKNVPRLANPSHDAQLVATAFRDIGFEVLVSIDLTHQQMIDGLRRFRDFASGADWAAIYFSGHGVAIAGTNYLMPIDARIDGVSDVQRQSVSLDDLLSSQTGVRQVRVAILDACRDNPFQALGKGTSTRGIQVTKEASAPQEQPASRTRGLARVEPPPSTIIVYSAGDGAVALDGQGETSPFADALAKRLRQPGLEIGKTFRLVRDDVLRASAGAQTPAIYSSLSGDDFYFVPPSTTAR